MSVGTDELLGRELRLMIRSVRADTGGGSGSCRAAAPKQARSPPRRQAVPTRFSRNRLWAMLFSSFQLYATLFPESTTFLSICGYSDVTTELCARSRPNLNAAVASPANCH